MVRSFLIVFTLYRMSIPMRNCSHAAKVCNLDCNFLQRRSHWRQVHIACTHARMEDTFVVDNDMLSVTLKCMIHDVKSHFLQTVCKMSASSSYTYITWNLALFCSLNMCRVPYISVLQLTIINHIVRFFSIAYYAYFYNHHTTCHFGVDKPILIDAAPLKFFSILHMMD